MSVTFNKDAKFGNVSGQEVENGADGEKGRMASAYARRMSRRGSVLNPQAPPPPPGTLVNSDRAYSVIAETIPDFVDMHDEAREHIEKETTMGFWQGMRTYPKAAAWSVLLSSSIIVSALASLQHSFSSDNQRWKATTQICSVCSPLAPDAYPPDEYPPNTNLPGSFFAFPQFNQNYGTQLASGEYQVPSAWQAGLMNGALAGSMVGLAMNGILCDKIGFKKTYYIGLALMVAAIFLPFFATGIPMLMAGQVISGVPCKLLYILAGDLVSSPISSGGMFQTLSVAYASEVCPTCLRGYLTTYANICWVSLEARRCTGSDITPGHRSSFVFWYLTRHAFHTGRMVLPYVLEKIRSHNLTEPWLGIPFALQWVFPPPIFIGLIFAPESPWVCSSI